MGIFNFFKKDNRAAEKNKDNDITNVEIDNNELAEILNQVHKLAGTINTTNDRDVFESALDEVKHKLIYLIKFEDTGIFGNSTPSQDLKKTYDEEPKIRENFEKRLKAQNSASNFDHIEKKASRIYKVDSCFFEAGRFIIEKDKASIGMLQRMLKIGFNRAERIMNQLGEAGVVGEEDGLKPRKVLMSIDEFEYLKANYKGRLEDYSPPLATAKKQQITIPEKVFMYNNKYDYMEGHDFELFCAYLLQKNGFQSVNVTQASGDQGIDIIALKDGVKYGIQCKCYSSDIGNKAVQEAFAGAKFYDCHVPAVLTNQFFTSAAKELAEKTNVLLWDRGYLDILISNEPQ